MINDASAVKAIEADAQKESWTVEYAPTPFTWGEDFGQFTRKFRGAFFGLGAGSQVAPLHHPGYDFPDDLIEPGSRIFYQLAIDLLQADL
jgi:metal-dependent amidase/aminoacylase/carboxypeptidase family protein